MNDQQLQQKIRQSMPETPYGFETRTDAQTASLVREGRGGVRVFPMRRLAALAVAVTLLLAAAIGYAVNAPIPGHVTIRAARLDRDAGLTEDTWYPDNTMGLAGLSLRDRNPSLTDKWYNVVPVDLTREGRQTFTLVASNMYYIGEAYVDVSKDSVTVSYGTYRGNLTMGEECLAWFLDEKELTTAYLENPESRYRFGEPVSIKEQLNGAEVALLFICNRVTYRLPFDSNGASLVRYYPNLDEWKASRSAMEPMMTQLAQQAQRFEEEARAKAEAEAQAQAEAEARAKAEAEAQAQAEAEARAKAEAEAQAQAEAEAQAQAEAEAQAQAEVEAQPQAEADAPAAPSSDEVQP